MKTETLSLKTKKIISVISIIFFIVFCLIVGYFVGKPMINFVSQPEMFRNWVESKGFLGKIAFIGMVIFQVVIALVPGEPLEIGAGYAFGGFEGSVLCILGITLGSMLVFWLVRKFGVKLVEVFFPIDKINHLKILKNKKRTGFIIFLIFFLPGTPKDLITYFVGLTDIKFSNFLLLASLARLPSIITSTLGGGALGTKEYISAIIIFLVAGVLSLLGIIFYRFLLPKFKKD